VFVRRAEIQLMTATRPSLAISDVRHSIRAPLHSLISCVEGIIERRAAIQNAKLISALTEILNHCEKILATVGSASDARRNDISFEEIAPELEEAGLLLVQLAEAIPADHLAINLDADIAKICAAANEYLQHIKRVRSHGIAAIRGRNRAANAGAVSLAIRGVVLVVDDNEENRDVLSRRLLRDGHEVMLAEGGRHALRMLQRYPFDLVLLDIMMPDMDGYEVLAEVKGDSKLKHLPVIMITAVDDIESVVRCIEMGADDYLLKPFNKVLLQARVNSLLERKRLRDEEVRKTTELKQLLTDIEEQRLRSQNLLLNILPEAVATELQNTGSVQPKYFEDVTIVFADIVGFTLSTEQIPADELVQTLHEYFTAFDRLIGQYGLEKLKTIGDCYMFAGGLPVRSPSNPVDCVLAALEMVQAVQQLAETGEVGWRIRIGINTGPVIAGVVGIRKFAFDIWGDSVNFSARIESAGRANRVNLSAGTYARVRDFFDCEKQEKVRVKEGREVDTYLVKGVSARLVAKHPNLSVRESFAQRYSRYFLKPLTAFPSFDVTLPACNGNGHA